MRSTSHSHQVSGPFRRALAASVSGQALEWYDFAIYGLAASTVFPRIFFPGASPLMGLLASFATFAVGFVARPVGGVIFGRLGDRIGRKPALMLTLLLMGVSTVIIGLLPDFGTIGVLAPILLVVLRLAQGIGVGGEWSGAAVLVIESAPTHRRGFFSSMINSGEYIGTLVAAGVFTALNAMMPQDAFYAWGWRIPFVLASVGIIFSLVIRRKVDETPAFAEIAEKASANQPGLGASLRAQWRNVIAIIGLRMFENASAYIILAFAVTYATRAGNAESTATLGVTIASAVAIPLIPLFGRLSDRIGRKRVYLIGVVFLLIFFVPFFTLIESQQPLLVWTAFILIFALGMAPMLAAQPAWFAEMFPTAFRYSGTAISTNVATVFAGGMAPFIATALLNSTGNLTFVFVYLGVLGLVTLAATLFTRETLGTDLDAPACTAQSAAPALSPAVSDRG
ncbi:MFS transporter [Paenarthrobacter nicotinovorans]|uniref:MFS transporter n=1 Tax=Paenarthrobacter nicotinovorans TaxID=29320 RepID=UPI0037488454